MSRMARPIVALARKPGPMQPLPPWMPISAAYGPLTIIIGATPCIVPWTPLTLNSSRSMSSTAPITTGRYSGRQPAISAWTATSRTVAVSMAGGMGPITSSGSRLVAPRIRAIRSSVGVTTGKPSDQIFSRKNSNSSTCSFNGSLLCPDRLEIYDGVYVLRWLATSSTNCNVNSRISSGWRLLTGWGSTT